MATTDPNIAPIRNPLIAKRSDIASRASQRSHPKACAALKSIVLKAARGAPSENAPSQIRIGQLFANSHWSGEMLTDALSTLLRLANHYRGSEKKYRFIQALGPTTTRCEGTGVAFDGTFTMSS